MSSKQTQQSHEGIAWMAEVWNILLHLNHCKVFVKYPFGIKTLLTN